MRRLRPARLLPVLLLLAVPFLAPVLGPNTSHAEAPPKVVVPDGLPVQLDGVATPAEWSRALRLPTADTDTELRVMQYRGTLLLALTSKSSWPRGGRLVCYLGKTDRDGGYLADEAVTIDYEPFEHDRRHTRVTRMQGSMTLVLNEQVVVRSRTAGKGSSLEMAFPLTLPGLDADRRKRQDLRMLLWWVRPDRAARPLTWPADVDVITRKQGGPVDLASSARWGVLSELTQVGGPGAWPKQQWAAWAAEEDEIALLGQTAHAKAMEVEEERIDIAKVDHEIQAALFDKLDALARREPLTAQDQMARAMGFRAMNNYGPAIEIYRHLADTRDPRTAGLAVYELARCLREANRFTEEAEAWRRVAALPGASANARHYLNQAQRAEEFATAWQRELRHRAEDAAKGPLPLVRLETEHGPVYIRVFQHDLPEVAAHWLGLIRRGFYDGTRFHRVVARFVTQGGDPLSREDCEAAGAGSSEHKLNSDPNPRHDFFRGSVGMAADISGSLGSQFFICTAPQPALDREGYVCIGYIEAGQAALDRVARCDRLIKAEVLGAAPGPAAQTPAKDIAGPGAGAPPGGDAAPAGQEADAEEKPPEPDDGK